MNDPQPKDAQTTVEEAQDLPQYQNPQAAALREADFQQWRHNPITRSFLLFLAHRSDSLTKTAAQLYLAGSLEQADKQGLRGRILELEELCGLKLGDIHQFYGVAPMQPQQTDK